MVHHIPLKDVYPNPWQTRQGDPDPEYIKELALDIAKNGLLQAPVGRLKDQNKFDQVELAFGHNRLAAYKWLLDVGEYSNIPGKFATLPVDICLLSDQQMADFAWSENERRRDISPYERALAIQKRIDDFEWTQQQAAEHLGISRSAIANILRLLKLPEDVQQALAEGKISERSAQALVTLFDLPADLRKRGENQGWNQIRPSDIVREAIAGRPSNEIRDRIERLIGQFSYNLQNAAWDLDDELPHTGAKTVACRDCELRYKPRNVCLYRECFTLKDRLWKQKSLEEASQVSGIPILEPDVDPNQVSDLDDWATHNYTERIIATGCDNLRLKYTYAGRGGDLRVDGHPNAEIVCRKRNGYCSCLKGLKMMDELDRKQAANAGAEIPGVEAVKPDGPDLGERLGDLGYPPNGKPLMQVLDPEYIPIEETETALDAAPVSPVATPTPAELQELARQARIEAQLAKKEARSLVELFGKRFMHMLNQEHRGAWRAMAEQINWAIKNQVDDHTPTDEIKRLIGEYIAEQCLPYKFETLTQLYEHFNRRLEDRFGLSLQADEEGLHE